MTTVPVLPKRGGIHSIYGVYVGGATIDDNYHLIGTRHYKSSTQRRNAKSIGRIESDLRSARDSTSILKFNGNLEGTPNGAELDKKTFSRPSNVSPWNMAIIITGSIRIQMISPP